MKRILLIFTVFLLLTPSSFGDCIFLADYNDGNLDADYSAGSPTATFAASRDATHPATYFDSNGVMQKTETSDVGRFNYGYYDTTGWHKWADGECGLMREGAATNYFSDSYFSEATITDYWSIQDGGGGPAIANSTEQTPIYGSNCMKFTASITDDRVYQQVTVATATVVTYSVWLRGSGDIYLWSGATGDQYGSKITLQNTQWRRYTFTFTTDNGDGKEHPGIRLKEDNAVTCYASCFQIEILPFASSFIPTTAASLTRNAETLKYETSGNRNAAKESFIIKFAPEFAKTGGSNYPYITSVDTKSREIYYDPVSGDAFNVYSNRTDSGNSKVNTLGTPAWLANAELTLGYNMQHSSPYIAGFFNGIADGTNETVDDFTNPAWGTYFWIGNKYDGNFQFYGTIKSISFFDTVLPASEMLRFHNQDWGECRFKQ